MESMNYQRCLTQFYQPFAEKAYGKDCILCQDNAPFHTSFVTEKFLEANSIKTTDWPPESPDLNCIEKVWHELKHYLRKTVKPMNKQQLEDGIKEFWVTRMTPEKCQRYINHVPDVVELVIKNEGGPMGK